MSRAAHLRAAFIGVAALLIAGSAQAQTISAGGSVSGSLSSGDSRASNGQYEDSYRLEGRAGQTLRLGLHGEGIDTLVRITGPNGFSQQDDDSGEGLDAQLDVTLPANGRYTVVVTTWAANVTGNYTLQVSESGAQSAQSGEGVGVGQNLSGSLRSGDSTRSAGQFVDSYTFEGQYGQQIEIRMNAPSFDPLLSVSGPGNFSAQNDDDVESSQPLRNSRLVLTLPQTGAYTVQATSFSSGATGDYTLQISSASGAPTQNSAATSGQVLAFGQPGRGTLAQGDGQLSSGEFADPYRFLGQQGQRVTIDMRSSDLDSYLIVVPPEGAQVDNDDFAGQGTNSRVELTLAATGEYRIFATTFRPGETGSYEVMVTSADGGREVAANTGSSAAVGSDQAASGTLAQSDPTTDGGAHYDSYTFTGRRGESVTVEMTSSDFDTYLALVSPSGEAQQNDDGIAGTTNSRVTWTLPANGDYTIVATSYAAGRTGSYNVRIARGGAPAQTASSSGRVYVLSVGISDYGGSGDLAFTADDARNLYAAMQRTGALAPESTVITDGQATRANVRAAFQRIASRVGPNDLFVFFYSGHGSQENASAGGELDGRDESIVMRDGTISDNEMAQWFGQLNGRLAVIALDSCFSGGFARDVVSRPRVMGLFSSDEDLTSAVAGKFRAGGYLSHFLVNGMQGQADENGDGEITAGELHAYLWRQFASEPNIGASSMDGESNYQRLVVDRGGVKVDDVVVALR